MALDTPIDKRKRRTHVAVLDAAETLLLQDGYRGMTIEMLAATADVAVSSIYANFSEGKADVYAALAWRTATRHAETMNATTAQSDPKLVVADALDRYAAFHRQNPLALRLLGLYDVNKTDSELVVQAKLQIDQVLDGLIQSATRTVEQAGSDADPHALVLNVWAAMNGAFSLRHRQIVDDETLDAMLAITRADVLRHIIGDDIAPR